MKKNSLCLLAAMAGFAMAGTTQAVNLSVVPGTSSPSTAGQTITGVVLNAANTSSDRGWNLTLQFPTGVTATNVVGNTGSSNPLDSAGSCTYNGTTNRLIVASIDFADTGRAAGTACTFDLVFAAGTAGTVLAIEQQAAPGCTATTAAGTCTASVTDADAGSDPGAAGVPEAHSATITAITGPTLTPPAGGTTVTLGGGTVGQQVTSNIQYSATGGTAGQSSTLTCTATAPAVVVSGSPQTITTGGAQPAPVVVGITAPPSRSMPRPAPRSPVRP